MKGGATESEAGRGGGPADPPTELEQLDNETALAERMDINKKFANSSNEQFEKLYKV